MKNTSVYVNRAFLVVLTIFSACTAYRIGDLVTPTVQSDLKVLGRIEVVTNDRWKDSPPEVRKSWRNYFASALRETNAFSQVVEVEAPTGRNVVASVNIRSHSFGAPVLAGFTLGLIPAPGYNTRGFIIDFKNPQGKEFKIVSGGDVSEMTCWLCFLWSLSSNWTIDGSDLYPPLIEILKKDLKERPELELLFTRS